MTIFEELAVAETIPVRRGRLQALTIEASLFPRVRAPFGFARIIPTGEPGKV